MSVLILSDSHGAVHEVVEVVGRHPEAEAIFHCGDFCVDPKRAPFAKMELVRGNCDFATEIPNERTTYWNGLTFYQTHGHLYDVKYSLLSLRYRAEEVGANVVLFGHSHFPVCDVEEGILYINPGSLMLPRGFHTASYVTLSKVGETDTSIQVDVQFFDRKGAIVKERGGNFTVRR